MIILTNKHYKLSLVFLISIAINLISFESIAQERLPDQNVVRYVAPKESTALMSVKISNKYKPNYQPNIDRIIIWENKQNAEKHTFDVKDKYKKVENLYNEYLINIKLPAGNYKIAELIASTGFPIAGSFSMPVYTNITIPENKIVYLGHLEANVVEKTSDEQLRAGFVLPLLDQAVSGASGGTFIIEITDNYQEDIAHFSEKYSSLKGVDIEKLILPPWKQPSKGDMEPPAFRKNPWEN